MIVDIPRKIVGYLGWLSLVTKSASTMHVDQDGRHQRVSAIAGENFQLMRKDWNTKERQRLSICREGRKNLESSPASLTSSAHVVAENETSTIAASKQ